MGVGGGGTKRSAFPARLPAPSSPPVALSVCNSQDNVAQATVITASKCGGLHPKEAEDKQNHIVAVMQRFLMKFTVMDAQHLTCPHNTIHDFTNEEM